MWCVDRLGIQAYEYTLVEQDDSIPASTPELSITVASPSNANGGANWEQTWTQALGERTRATLGKTVGSFLPGQIQDRRASK